MEEERKLYPFKLVPIEDGVHSVQIADLGYQDTEVQNGWLAASTVSELMEMYMDRLVGEAAFAYYGRQFPVASRYIRVEDRLPLMVCPDDEIASQRLDFLGKAKLWYIADASEDARIFLGFGRDVEPAEFYMACRHAANSGAGSGKANSHGTEVEGMLNAVHPHKGDYFFIPPGTVHGAAGHVTILEVSECSPLDFRIFDWGRESELDEFDAALSLDAAFDFINYRAHTSACHCHEHEHEHGEHCHCHEHEHGEHCHCHEHGGHGHGQEGPIHEDREAAERLAKRLTDNPEFTVTELRLHDPMHIYSEQFGCFVLYTCVEGEISLQIPATASEPLQNVILKAGESALVPAEVKDFFLVPLDRSSVLLETIVEQRPEIDSYTGEESDGHDHDGCGCGHDHHDDDPDDDEPLIYS